MSYIATPPVVTPPTPTLPAFRRGGMGITMPAGQHGPFAQSVDGTRFTTEEPFDVADYAIFAGISVATATAVLNQAVIDGDVSVV